MANKITPGKTKQTNPVGMSSKPRKAVHQEGEDPHPKKVGKVMPKARGGHPTHCAVKGCR